MRDPEIERYGAMAPLTASEQLAERAWKGDPAALETVLLEAQRHHYETVEAVLLGSLSLGSGPPYQDISDFLAVKMANMRHELAPPGSSPAEKLLAERATLCWLHMELLEYEAARLFKEQQRSARELELRDFSVTLLQFSQEYWPVLFRSRLSHDLSPVQGLFLAPWLLSSPIRQQIVCGERCGMGNVCVQSMHQRWSLEDNANPRVTMTVDPPFVALG